jgi:3-hydroxyisobutyrate dehydrogenase
LKESIGFIGLGIMGQGMARNLLKAGYELRVWNRTANKMEALVAEGAIRSSNPAGLAVESDIIITCVSDTPDVVQVLTGEEGVIHGAQPGALVIDMSTINPDVTRQIAAQFTERGVHTLDAPVSGGSEGAARGTLAIMVGGETEQFERTLPVLQAMGKAITHVGGHGDGQMVKLVNQILVVGYALSISEALLFAQAGGLDLKKTIEAVASGAAGSWMLSNRGPQILVRDWRPGFMIDLQQKDVRLVLAEADRLGLPVLMSSLVFNLYRTLQNDGLGAEGNHALIKALEKLSGVEVKASE